jgi:putative DNA primase/helicase
VSRLAEQHERAAAECQALLAGAASSEGHPYLARKGIPMPGLPQGTPGQSITVIKDGAPRVVDLAGRLFIPMRDIDGKLWSLQYINPDGGKWYHPGGRKEGCLFAFDIASNRDQVIICEGYATATSLADMMKSVPVVAAFDAGNLIHMAREWKRRYPEISIIVAGDHDHRREAEGKPNTGKLAAIAAADAVGGVAVLPNFKPGDAGSDWNDRVAAVGVDEARAQFRLGLQLAECAASPNERTP